MNAAAAPIRFYFDFSSPYAYIAHTWLEPLAARHGRAVERHAILLGATFQAAELKSPISYPLKREYSLHDFERSARFEGVPYVHPPTFPLPTQNAARVFWWLHDTRGPDTAAAWTRSALAAMFTQGRALNDTAVLRALAADAGVAADLAEAAWNDPHWKARLKQVNDDAIAAGVFGTPWFVVDGEPFWGNDRKPQIERWLAQGAF